MPIDIPSKINPPYPYFGGKRRVASLIWSKLGKISNYVEPFMGSLSVLLANIDIPKIETVNDINCFISNFYRAIAADPEGVAKHADYPIIEADLHARHRFLLSGTTNDFRKEMDTNPDFYDVKVAGWWVWGQCASIGDNWLSSSAKGLTSTPLLSSAGGGIHGLTYDVSTEFKKLQVRLKRVRVCCGDWKRVMKPSVLHNNVGLGKNDITGIFLDPPYQQEGRDKVYTHDEDIFNEVMQWAIDNGNNEKLRIILCGYDNNQIFPEGWEKIHWNANGGMANLGNERGKNNAKKETIWCSPQCLNINVQNVT